MTMAAKTLINKKLNWAQKGQAEVLTHQDFLAQMTKARNASKCYYLVKK